MKIVQINCVYNEGSTGRIVADIHNYSLKKGIESFALYGRGIVSEGKNEIKVSSELEAKIHSVMTRCTGLDFAYSPLATKKTIDIIEREKPTVVHLHCLNGHFLNVYIILKYLKSHSIKTVLTLHAEIMHTAGCEHAYDCEKWKTGCFDCQKIRGALTHYFRDDTKKAFKLMQDAFSGFNNLTVVGVSDWLTDRARQAAIFKYCQPKFATVYNGCDLSQFVPMKVEKEVDKPIILHVTPNFMHPLKGGKYVLELAQKNPQWQFIILGYNGNGSGLIENVKVVSKTNSRAELARYYNMADVTLLTSSRETFSMVCLESLSCGTPVVGFEAGGPESVFVGDFAKFVEYGNTNALSNAVKEMLNHDVNINTQELALKFSSDMMAKNYFDLYR